MFKGTVRTNLDPFGECMDAQVRGAQRAAPFNRRTVQRLPVWQWSIISLYPPRPALLWTQYPSAHALPPPTQHLTQKHKVQKHKVHTYISRRSLPLGPPARRSGRR